jgi:hypothetical protein
MPSVVGINYRAFFEIRQSAVSFFRVGMNEDLTSDRMEQVIEMYRSLRGVLITKYTNNHEWL